MKICFVTSTIFCLGGVQRVVTVISNELSKENEIDILCTDDKYGIDRSLYGLNNNITVIINPDLLINKEKFTNKIIYKLFRKVNYITGAFNNNNMLKILEELYYPHQIKDKFTEYFNSKNYDLIVGVEGYYSLLIGAISNKLNAKTIGWQHNSYDAYFNNRYKYHWNQHQLFKEYIPRLNQYIVLTNDDKKKLEEKMKIKSTVIYNPLSFRSNKKSQLDNKNIIFVGRLLEKQKGLDFLIEAFSLVNKEKNNWILKIVGDGPDKTKLIDSIEKYNLQNNVVLLGRSNDVKEHYIDSSIFLSTSRWEGFGLVITEAMECGLPVISFDNTGPGEIITEDKLNGILVPCYDVAKFAKSIIYLIENKYTRIEISRNAIERAKDFYIEKIIKQWNKIIDENI